MIIMGKAPAVKRMGSCYDRLSQAVSSAKAHVPLLEAAIHGGSAPVRGGGRMTPRSKPPWDAAVACLIIDLQHGARIHESQLRVAIGLPARDRGGSDANTYIALTNIVTLAGTAGESLASEPALWLERWNGRAARALGEASPFALLPRQPGEPERPCPFCQLLSLRYLPLHGMVKCINPSCRDEDGRRPSARIEFSMFTHQLELVWQDGVVGLPGLPGEAA
jgi:hypothetical protein